MLVTTSIRTAAKTRLIELLAEQSALAGVQGHTGFPGKLMDREHYWIQSVTGTVGDNLMKAGRRIRDDEFALTVVFRAEGPGWTIEQADARVEEMFAALEDQLADDTNLGGLDGVQWATLGPTVEGPDGELTDEGAISVISAEVTVRSRLK